MGQRPQNDKNAGCLKLKCFKVKTSIAADRAMSLSVMTLKCKEKKIPVSGWC